MMIKGNNPENIRVGSTLSTDEFAGTFFDFMLSNPPYGKSWSSEVKNIKEGKNIIDPRFVVKLCDYWGNEVESDAVPRSSDGQLLFLMEMVNKMKPLSKSGRGSRIASVHNGSSLLTGDAGGGESNIRRYIIENDLLEAIIQLPNNLFYNTGITTYIWLLSNNKQTCRKGKVQLIDASQRFAKLRKNLGAKNCEFKSEHIQEIEEIYSQLTEIKHQEESGLRSQIFNNEDFGYYKVIIERPQRLKAQFTMERITGLRFDKNFSTVMEWAYDNYGDKVYSDLENISEDILSWCEKNDIELSAKKKKALTSKNTWEKPKQLFEVAEKLVKIIGQNVYDDFNLFKVTVEKKLKAAKIKLSASEKNAIYTAVSWYDKNATKVIKNKQTLNGDKLNKLLDRLGCTVEELSNYGYYSTEKKDEFITYEAQNDLRDSENVPLEDSIYHYFLQEVKPHLSEAWIDLEKTKIGYEVNFNKYFYQHKSLRSLEEVTAEILELEKDHEGLIWDILEMG